MNFFRSDIVISAPSKEVLERVLSSRIFTVGDFTKYYPTPPQDGMTYLIPIEEQERSIKLFASTRGFIPISYFRSILQEIEEDLVVDFIVHDDNGGCTHYRLTPNKLSLLYDQDDFEADLDWMLGTEQLDEYDLIKEHLCKSQYCWEKNLDDADAPTEYGERLIIPERYIPDHMREVYKTNPDILFRYFDTVARIGREMRKKKASKTKAAQKAAKGFRSSLL